MILRLTPTCVLRVQSQVDEVIDVMQENISKVIERGERLDDLQDKSGESHSDSLCSCVCPHDLQSKTKLTQTVQGIFYQSGLF